MAIRFGNPWERGNLAPCTKELEGGFLTGSSYLPLPEISSAQMASSGIARPRIASRRVRLGLGDSAF